MLVFLSHDSVVRRLTRSYVAFGRLRVIGWHLEVETWCDFSLDHVNPTRKAISSLDLSKPFVSRSVIGLTDSNVKTRFKRRWRVVFIHHD